MESSCAPADADGDAHVINIERVQRRREAGDTAT
jgi:hypothetical protein